MTRTWLVAGALNMLIALIVAASVGHRLEGEFVPVIRNIFDTAREIISCTPWVSSRSAS